MNETKCPLCRKPVDNNDPSSWKQVQGWVGGPRKDSMRLREDTGKYAHDYCIKKIQEGQAIDQAELWDEVVYTSGEDVPTESNAGGVDDLEDLLDD